jgi:hypothetical protein
MVTVTKTWVMSRRALAVVMMTVVVMEQWDTFEVTNKSENQSSIYITLSALSHCTIEPSTGHRTEHGKISNT